MNLPLAILIGTFAIICVIVVRLGLAMDRAIHRDAPRPDYGIHHDGEWKVIKDLRELAKDAD